MRISDWSSDVCSSDLDAAFGHALAENVAPLVVELTGSHDAFVAPATSNGKNIAPRVAALLDVMQISDILSVESERSEERRVGNEGGSTCKSRWLTEH